MKTVLTAVVVGFLGCNMLCEQAKAQPLLTGTINFDGSASASGTSPGIPFVTITPNNDWTVIGFPAPTGDFASVTAGTPATFHPFSFTGTGAGAALTASVIPEWSFSFGGINYSFDLTSLTTGSVSSGIGGVSMDFTGLGTLHATDAITNASVFADTPGTWAMSGTGEDLNFIFSEAHTTAVPEGGVISLLTLGLGILGGKSLLRRRETSTKA